MGVLLRMGLLCCAFCFPVYASLPAAATFTPPAPSRIPLLGLLVDGYHLWMSEWQHNSSPLWGTAAGLLAHWQVSPAATQLDRPLY